MADKEVKQKHFKVYMHSEIYFVHANSEQDALELVRIGKVMCCGVRRPGHKGVSVEEIIEVHCED